MLICVQRIGIEKYVQIKVPVRDITIKDSKTDYYSDFQGSRVWYPIRAFYRFSKELLKVALPLNKLFLFDLGFSVLQYDLPPHVNVDVIYCLFQ